MSHLVSILFQKFDKNGDGYLDHKEVYDLLKEVEVAMKKKGKDFRVNQTMVDNLFKLCDDNNDRKISLKEMSTLLGTIMNK